METTPGTNEDGHPFDPNNKLLFVGLYDGNIRHLFDIEFSSAPYGDKIKDIQAILDSFDCIVAFNAKFDLHWLRRYGIKHEHKEVWDLQYAEFCLSGQTWKMPDCDTACTNRGIKGKLPFDHAVSHSREEWEAYLGQDLNCEFELFRAQVEGLVGSNKSNLESLIWFGSQDLKVTEEMGWNGILYDVNKSIKIGDEILEKVVLMDTALYEYAPFPWFNWASPDHVSAILYGGMVSHETVEPFTFVYKNGTTKEKTRKVDKQVLFPRLVEPLKNTDAKKNVDEPETAYHRFSTNEGILRRLKALGSAKSIISLLLKRRELEKKVGTYYHGIPTLMEKMGWQGNIIHGQLNHCVAATGRLSSSKPNLQNLEALMRQCVLSRFPLQCSESA